MSCLRLSDKRTIGATLAAFNDSDPILRDHRSNTVALRYGRGAELLGQWTLCNARSGVRMVQLAQPGDRIFVAFGAGHRYLWRQCPSTCRSTSGP